MPQTLFKTLAKFQPIMLEKCHAITITLWPKMACKKEHKKEHDKERSILVFCPTPFVV